MERWTSSPLWTQHFQLINGNHTSAHLLCAHLTAGEHKAPAAKHGSEHDAAAFVAPTIARCPLWHRQPLSQGFTAHQIQTLPQKKNNTPLQFNPNSGKANKLGTLHIKAELREVELCAWGDPPDANIKSFHGAFYSDWATWPNETDRVDCVCSCVCLCVRMCMRRHPFTLHLWCVLLLWGMHAVALWTSTLAAPAVAKQLQTGCSRARAFDGKTQSFFCLSLFAFFFLFGQRMT